jgi:ubiquinone/menaquinone biosynthesis C-methylase UbiE
MGRYGSTRGNGKDAKIVRSSLNIIERLSYMKSFDSTWEKIHNSQDWGKYPQEEVVRFFGRNYKESRDNIKVLDLGCGAGAHTWYLAREGFSTYAIDGSHSAVERTKQLLSQMNLSAEFNCGDFGQLPYQDNYFDVVLDGSAIGCQVLSSIKHILNECNRVLVKRGSLFSTGNFTLNSAGYGTGEEIEPNTFRLVDKGPFIGIGTLHYFSENELRNLYSEAMFDIISLDTLTRTDYNNEHTTSYYIVYAKKR